MKSFGAMLVCGLVIASFIGSARAEGPHIGYVLPAGGQRGTTFQVDVGGGQQQLKRVLGVYFSGTGVDASVVPPASYVLENKEMRKGDARLAELRKRGGDLDANEREESARLNSAHLPGMRSEDAKSLGDLSIIDTLKIQATIAPDAAPGMREMRVLTRAGMSNPLRFYVGSMPEVPWREPGYIVAPPGIEYDVAIFPPMFTTDVTLPCVANGRIYPHMREARFWHQDTPGDAKRYRFDARKGQQLVISAAAREVIPYMADAVPGWLKATLTLYDTQGESNVPLADSRSNSWIYSNKALRGKELAYSDQYRFNPDPVIFFKVPADGQYEVEIKDSIYRGRLDFVYRITAGELPFITGIFPLGGPAGTQTPVKLMGYNLPSDTLTMDAKDKAPGVYPISVSQGNMTSNVLKFAVDTLPECLADGNNHTPQTAQALTLPVIVNGQISQPGEWSVFRFEGHAGQEIVAEVVARRLESPLASVLELTDANGRRVAFNNGHDDLGDGLHTDHADSLIQCKLPSDGTYYVRLGDVLQNGGPEYAYRLRISEPRPGFELRVSPSCINTRSDQLMPITVFAIRKDGFNGPIALSLKDMPKGLAIDGAVVPEGQDRVRVTLAVPPLEQMIDLNLEGRATIGGKEIVRKAGGADEMEEAFYYKHLVPSEKLALICTNAPPPPPPAAQSTPQPADAMSGAMSAVATPATSNAATKPVKKPDVAKVPPPKAQPPAPQPAFQRLMWPLGPPCVKIPLGGTGEYEIGRPAGTGGAGDLIFELSDAPEGITVDKVSWTAKGFAVVFRADAKKAKTGFKTNLIGSVFWKQIVKGKGGATHEEHPLMGLAPPAIPVEIVEPANKGKLGTVTI